MTEGCGRILDMCVDLVGMGDVDHLRLLLANGMANILGARAVVLMGLNDTQDRCVPLASWPYGLSQGVQAPSWDLPSLERSVDPLVWALRLSAPMHEASAPAALMADLRAMLGLRSEGGYLTVIPARFSNGSFADMLFVAIVSQPQFDRTFTDLVAKFARFSTRINQMHCLLDQGRVAADTLARSVQNADRREVQLRQAVPAALAAMLVGNSAEMRELREAVVALSIGSGLVLLEGERGTGKELVAHMLHDLGERRSGPFVHVAAKNLFLKENRSQFSGEETAALFLENASVMAAVHGGTLFVEEIAELPLSQQGALLAVHERKILPVRGSVGRTADFRLIVSNTIAPGGQPPRRDLHAGFLDRQMATRLRLPALRERRIDIPELSFHFARTFARLRGVEQSRLSPEALRLLGEYDYPANVRELKSIVTEAASLAGSGNTVCEGHIRCLIESAADAGSSNGLREACDTFEREFIRRRLVDAGGNRSRVANELRIPLRTLADKLKKHGLERISYDTENNHTVHGIRDYVAFGGGM